MKKYRVLIEIAHREWYTVEAASEEAAKQKAEELSEDGEEAEDCSDMFVRDIQVVALE